MKRAKRRFPIVWTVGLCAAAVLIGVYGVVMVLRHPRKLAVPAYDKTVVAATYLIFFETDMRMHSERDGRIDTPMEHRTKNDIARVQLNTIHTASGSRSLQLKPLEWVSTDKRIENVFVGEDADSPAPRQDSIAWALTDPALTPMQMELDSRGAVMRYQGDGILMRGAAHLVAPMFPRQGRIKTAQWIEPVRWETSVGGWTLTWGGEILWRCEKLTPCGDHDCLSLSLEGIVRPQVRSWPAWGPKAWPLLEHQGHLSGQALFDPKLGALVAQTIEWRSQWRGRIDDVGRIPLEIRIGRSVEGIGEVIMECSGRMNVRLLQ